MEYYKVLLVDDEEEVRQAIAQKLHWNELGFEVAGEAANGEEALEMLETLQPDVIMTDIKMPFMDGLTLCRHAKQLLPGVRVAIFSGFDEFEYAKEAIKLEVEEYILKPINAEELAGVFRRLRASLDEEAAERRDVQRLRAYYEESLPLMRQQLLLALLEGRQDTARLQQRMAEYGMQLAAERYCVAVVRYDEEYPHPEESMGSTRQSAQLRGTALQHLAQDSLTGPLPFVMVPALECIILLFLLPAGQDEASVLPLLNQLFLPAKKFLQLHLAIGLGNCRNTLADIYLSYEEALSALEYQILVGPQQCVYIGDIEPQTAGAVQWDAGGIEEVVRQIKIGHGADLQVAVATLIDQLRHGPANLQQYQLFMLEMSTELLKLIRAYKLDAGAENPGRELLEKGAKPFAHLDEMGHWLLDYCDRLRHLIRRERKDSTNTVIQRARDILATRYADSDLSVEVLSRQLNVSPAYFSTIFKKETGLNFIAYLTQLRLEKALEYLTTTTDKTYLIAQKVGYADANYFSYVFKKQYGVSPSKYRTDRMAGHGADQKSS